MRNSIISTSAENMASFPNKFNNFYFMPREKTHDFEINSKRIQQAYRYIFNLKLVQILFYRSIGTNHDSNDKAVLEELNILHTPNQRYQNASKRLSML